MKVGDVVDVMVLEALNPMDKKKRKWVWET